MNNIEKITYIKVEDQYVDFKIKSISKDKSEIIFSFWDKDRGIDGGCIINTNSDDKDYNYTIKTLFLNGKEILDNKNINNDDVIKVDDYIPNIDMCLFTSEFNTVNIMVKCIDNESRYKMIIEKCNFNTQKTESLYHTIDSKWYFNPDILLFESTINTSLLLKLTTGDFILSYNETPILNGNINFKNEYYIMDYGLKDKDIVRIYIRHGDEEILKIINSYIVSEMH